MYCFFSGLKMSDSPLPLVSTPSRITDYFPPSPKTSQETGKIFYYMNLDYENVTNGPVPIVKVHLYV